MVRLILLVALVLAATYLVEAVARQVRRQLGDPGRGGQQRIRNAGPRHAGPRDAGARRRAGGLQAPGGELVACGCCGVHTPASRALWHGKAGPFCSEACRRRAAASRAV